MDDFWDEIETALETSALDQKHFLSDASFKRLITEERIRSVSSTEVTTPFEGSMKVIAILLMVDKLDTLAALHSEGLTDKDLPVELSENRTALVSVHRVFRSLSRPRHNVQFFADQWRFLSPVLGGTDTTEVDQRCPLPIIYKGSSQVRGGFSRVSEVKFHHAHLKLPAVSLLRASSGLL